MVYYTEWFYEINLKVASKAALKTAGADVEVISLHEGCIRGMNLTERTTRRRRHASPFG